MPKTKVDVDTLAYLTVTANRFKCLIEIWTHMTGQEAAELVRDLDALLVARKVGTFTPAVLAAFAAGYDAGEGREPSVN